MSGVQMQPVHHRTHQSATASARSASRGSQKVCTVCVYMCAHVWLYVANPDEGGGVGKVHLEAWIKAPKLGAVQNSLLLCIPPTPHFVGMAETSI